MGTPNSPTSFRAHELRHSTDPAVQDFEGAARAREVVEALVEQLKPIVEYVAVRVEFTEAPHGDCVYHLSVPIKTMRGVKVILEEVTTPPEDLYYSRDELWLDEKGTFFILRYCRASRAHLYESGTESYPTWEWFLFDGIVTGLRDAFARAEERREKHLASIRTRRKLLDEVLAIVNRAENA